MRRALRMTEETYTKLRVLLGVELAVRQQRRLVVLRTVFSLIWVSLCSCERSTFYATYEDGLRHEGEVLCPPEVAIVHTSHEDVREEDADVLVNLEPEGVEQAVRADEVPVKAPREEAHALVVAGAAKDVAEDGARVVGEAEDRNASEKREDPCGRTASVTPRRWHGQTMDPHCGMISQTNMTRKTVQKRRTRFEVIWLS